MASAGFFDGARFSWSALRAYFCATLSDLCRAMAGTASMAMPASDADVAYRRDRRGGCTLRLRLPQRLPCSHKP